MTTYPMDLRKHLASRNWLREKRHGSKTMSLMKIIKKMRRMRTSLLLLPLPLPPDDEGALPRLAMPMPLPHDPEGVLPRLAMPMPMPMPPPRDFEDVLACLATQLDALQETELYVNSISPRQDTRGMIRKCLSQKRTSGLSGSLMRHWRQNRCSIVLGVRNDGLMSS